MKTSAYVGINKT